MFWKGRRKPSHRFSQINLLLEEENKPIEKFVRPKVKGSGGDTRSRRVVPQHLKTSSLRNKMTPPGVSGFGVRIYFTSSVYQPLLPNGSENVEPKHVTSNDPR